MIAVRKETFSAVDRAYKAIILCTLTYLEGLKRGILGYFFLFTAQNQTFISASPYPTAEELNKSREKGFKNNNQFL